MSNLKNPVRVAVTGAAGQISYALLFAIAKGNVFGKDQPVILRLLEISDDKAQKVLKGVMMELEDCAFELLAGMEAHADANMAFRDIDYAFLVGARPRTQGMERKDLLPLNAKIFANQGRALNDVANPKVKVLVVGNPANTNAYVTMKFAPNLDKANFSALMRLDHNRALSQIAFKIARPLSEIKKLCVWGNHSPCMYPDYRFSTSGQDKVVDLIQDQLNWQKNYFAPLVGKRGASVVDIRGSSSAASAANACVDHMRDWVLGSNQDWTTMGVASKGEYGVPPDMIFGFPVVCSNNGYEIVKDLPMDEFSQQRLQENVDELAQEIKEVDQLIANKLL